MEYIQIKSEFHQFYLTNLENNVKINSAIIWSWIDDEIMGKVAWLQKSICELEEKNQALMKMMAETNEQIYKERKETLYWKDIAEKGLKTMMAVDEKQNDDGIDDAINATVYIDRAIEMIKEEYRGTSAYNGIVGLLSYAKTSHLKAIQSLNNEIKIISKDVASLAKIANIMAGKIQQEKANDRPAADRD